MSDIKTILVAVSDGASGRAPLDMALLIGRDMGAHVKALHVRADPSNAVPLVGEGMSGVMVEEMISAAERQSAERAQAAKAMFEARQREEGVGIATGPGQGEAFSVCWREEMGREEDIVARCARLHDLTVLGRPVSDRELPSVMTLNAALLESGRALLVAPPQVPTTVGRKIVIAWNGSGEASRAVTAALPFLRRAESVLVLSAKEQDEDPVLTPAEMCNYLSWHGIRADSRSFSSGMLHTGEALENEVRASGADLLVMGAYTHSRLRQLILGGVTRHMLHHASIPVLMMH